MGRFADAAKKAADMTNKQLETELASIGKLDSVKIQELLPLKKDKKVFLDLMKEVEAETTMDQKIAYMQNNIASVGTMAVTLLKGLI